MSEADGTLESVGQTSGALPQAKGVIIRKSLAWRQRDLYRQDPIALITMVAPQLEARLPDTLIRTRVALAADPECPTTVLELLAFDSDNVVAAVISNPRCTLTALERAAEFRFRRRYWSSDRVLVRVSRHPLMDVALLRRFAPNRPSLVVSHPLCPVDLLVQFSESRNPNVRECAVRRRSLPTETLLQTIGDPDARVADAIRRSVSQRGHDTVREALKLMNARGRQQLLHTLEPDAIDRLAGDSDERIRYAVARTTHDPAVLRRLSADTHGRVRRAASDRVVTNLA